MIDEKMIRYDYAVLRPNLNERGRRLFAAAQARALGYGGIAAVARATGIQRRGRDRACAPPGRGAQEARRSRCQSAERSAAAGRAGNLGRPGAAFEMGLEEPRQACNSAGA